MSMIAKNVFNDIHTKFNQFRLNKPRTKKVFYLFLYKINNLETPTPKVCI